MVCPVIVVVVGDGSIVVVCVGIASVNVKTIYIVTDSW